MTETTNVKVSFCGLIKDVTGGEDFTISIGQGLSPRELCFQLGERYGKEYYERIFQSSGEMEPFVCLYVNNKQLERKQFEDRTVLTKAEKFEVFVVPLLMGG